MYNRTLESLEALSSRASKNHKDSLCILFRHLLPPAALWKEYPYVIFSRWFSGVRATN